MRTPISEQIANLKAQKEKLAARLNTLEAKAKQDNRKRDTRRKIVVGAAVLAAFDHEPALAAQVRKVLAAFVTRPNDKSVIADLLGSGVGTAAPPVASKSQA